MQPDIKRRTRCRICGSERLRKYLDLGEMPPANAFLAAEDLSRAEPRYPLRVFFCETCGLSQLGDVVAPGVLFRDYAYLTSVMPHASSHWRAYTDEIAARFVRPGKLVVELGSNDGLLLSFLRERGARILGVDPAENVAAIANGRGLPTIVDFFSTALAASIRAQHGPASAVLANNVVAHIDDHRDLMAGVCALLGDGGVFIFEAPHILDIREGLRFDTVYHEHLSYLSLRPIMGLLDAFGLEAFDVKTLPVQGTSFRVYSGRRGEHPISPAVAELLAVEERQGLHRFDTYAGMARGVEQLKTEVVTLLRGLKQHGKRIAAYGAPARGNVLLNYFGIGRDLLDHATEELPTKVGRYTPGTHIPVIPVEESRKNPPDYYLLLAWNYLDAVLEKERAFRERGGKFILPVGDMRIV